MLTWHCRSASRLLACGVDAERIERFEELSGRELPWPMVFSPGEASHNRGLPDPAEGFCAAFCCKEAVFKAIEQPFRFTDCELLLDPGRPDQALRLSPGLCGRLGIAASSARILHPRRGELAAVVYLWSA